MTIKLYDLAKVTTATTGTTSPLVLGSAASGFLSFAAAGVQDGETIRYAIRDGANSEIGWGVYSASGTTLTRNVTSSTNSNSAISLSSSAQVFICVSALDVSPGPAFHAYGSTATSVPINTPTKITLNAEVFDTDSCFDISTYKFTPNVAGYYQFSFNMIHPSGYLGVNFFGMVYKNGSSAIRGNEPASNSFGVCGSGLLYMNGSTDYAELYCFQASQNPATIGGGGASASENTFLSGFLARRA